MPNFKKLFGGLSKPKALKLEFSPMKTKMYSSRKLLIIGDHLFMRKDFVEQRIADVINVKIAKGELKQVKSDNKAKVKSDNKAKVESEKAKGDNGESK